MFRAPTIRRSALAIAMVCAGFVAAGGFPALRVVAQVTATQSTPKLPAFDVASIKRDTSNPPVMTVPIYLPGGHLSASNATLRMLISVAQKLPGFELVNQVTLVGGPSWMDSEHFDIEAEVEGDPSADEKRLMLQSLLVDRFKLKVHHETRQVPAFALVMDKGGKPGPQLQPHNPDEKCLSASEAHESPRPTPDAGKPAPVYCGDLTLWPGPFSSWRVVGDNVTLDYVASSLSYFEGIDRAIVNHTGMTRKFDVHLEYTPQIAGADAVDPSAPPLIVTAVQQQLGLKLESTKTSVDVLVIDHVEQPSPN